MKGAGCPSHEGIWPLRPIDVAAEVPESTLQRHSLDCLRWSGTAKGVSFLPSDFAPIPCSPLAKWETPFSDKNTHQEDFHVTPEQSMQVLMMNREDEYYHLVDRGISCTVVRLPYQGNVTALFILPDEGKMQQVENRMSEWALKNYLKIDTKRYFLSHPPSTPGKTHDPGQLRDGK